MPGFIEPVLWILFVAACLIISVVILLQEGKGGGLGEAFGGMGAQAFGVKAEGIQKFTGWVAASVVVLAILITLTRTDSDLGLPDALPAAPAGAVPGASASTPAPATGAPAGDEHAGHDHAPGEHGGAPAGDSGGAPAGDAGGTPDGEGDGK